MEEFVSGIILGIGYTLGGLGIYLVFKEIVIVLMQEFVDDRIKQKLIDNGFVSEDGTILIKRRQVK